MTQSAIDEIEQSIRESQKSIDLGIALDRLRNNRDFKKVVIEGYLEQEAIRLVHAKAQPDMQTPERQAAILAQIDAIGHFGAYLNTVVQRANVAVRDKSEAEVTRDELLQEEH